ncbi:MAG: trehalose-phosphatase [Myxococcales bacterium]
MKDILAPTNRGLLQRLADERVLVAFDYDGTLAPIVARPSEATMRPATRTLLRRVVGLYPCAVLTGRTRASAARLLDGVGVPFIIGNHGLEWPRASRVAVGVQRQVGAWKAALSRLSVPGIRVEDKAFSLTVHLRRSPAPEAASRAVSALAAELPGCRAEGGIEVVNLLPQAAPGKGEALLRLLGEARCSHAIFLGDDVTDEAVFRLRDPRVLSIRVGSRRGTAARYRVGSQRDVDALLRILIEARTKPPRRE